MGLSGTYNEIKALGKGFYQDARASHAGLKAEKIARNGVAKSKEYIRSANDFGRTAAYHANSAGRNAYRMGGGTTKSNLINAGIGAASLGALNAGKAYSDGYGGDGITRAAFKGAALGAGLGAGFNMGKSALWAGRNEISGIRSTMKGRAAASYADNAMAKALRKPQLMLPAPSASGFVPTNIDSMIKKASDFGPAGPNSFVRGTTALNYRG